MTARWLVFATVVTSLAYGSVARADEPYLRITTSGSPAATLRGNWDHDGKSAHLVLRGATTQLTPTTFDAGITFPAVGKRTGRCPSFSFWLAANGYLAPSARADITVGIRYRHPGGRWSPWDSSVPFGMRDGLRSGSAPVAGGVTTPPSSCRGAMEYGWRVHGTIGGEALLVELPFVLEVRER